MLQRIGQFMRAHILPPLLGKKNRPPWGIYAEKAITQKRRFNPPPPRGFTLLEVMIAMTLFSVMALFLMQITDSGVRYRKIAAKNVKAVRLIRTAREVLRKDFYNVFATVNPHELLWQAVQNDSLRGGSSRGAPRKTQLAPQKGASKKERLQLKRLQSQINDIAEPRPERRPLPLPVGQFKGDQNELFFTSLSYMRRQENEGASDHNLVLYYIKPCRNIKTGSRGKCLWRKSVLDLTAVDLKRDDIGEEFILVENVQQFKISYFNIFDNQWKGEWPLGMQKNNHLPMAVRVFLKFKDLKNRVFEEEMIFPIHRQAVSLRLQAG